MKKIILFTLLLSIFDFPKFLSVDEVFEPADSDKSFSEFKNILEKRINYLEKNENLSIGIFFDKNKSYGEKGKGKIVFVNYFNRDGDEKKIKIVDLNYIYFDSEKKLLKYIDTIINSCIFNGIENKSFKDKLEESKKKLENLEKDKHLTEKICKISFDFKNNLAHNYKSNVKYSL